MIDEEEYWDVVEETFKDWENDFKEVCDLDSQTFDEKSYRVKEALYRELENGNDIILEIVPQENEYVFWSKEQYENIMED